MALGQKPPQNRAQTGVRVVIVEDASRFARHLMTQESGIALLIGLGVRVLTANGDDLTDSDDEFRVAMRQIMGVFSQLERTRLVKKLKAARDRNRIKNGKRVKVEGRKSHAEERPEAVKEARRLRRAGFSYEKIGQMLAEKGMLNEHDRPFNPKSVRAMMPAEERARRVIAI
jgi:DNA invertase Pin-like site-specific DNA recombinase